MTPYAGTAVVLAMEAHIDSRVTQATRPVLDKLDAVQGVLSAQIRAISQFKSKTDKAREWRTERIRWVVGTVVATLAAGFGILKAFGLL